MLFTLLPIGDRSGVDEGSGFLTYRIADWSIEIGLTAIDAGQVDIAIETAPYGAHTIESGDWVQNGATISVSALGRSVEVRTLQETPMYLRAVVLASTTATRFTLEVLGRASFFNIDNTSAHFPLLHPAVRAHTEKGTLVELAEELVVSELRGRGNATGELRHLHSENPSAPDVIRRAIAEQAHYEVRRRALTSLAKKDAREMLSKMKRVSPEALAMLRTVMAGRKVIQHW